ncbi:hypothetical protein [Burkholderia pseudomallei]|uniref:hypothetical protein n=1 Tax=Burkholderia pseudomallei TaxID=28450 RepID=UPI000F0E8C32|nr:hypothetical protein [Burkholderia pseudomallei]VCJ27921.1 Uncharacterised protein [Burkholderia pseudomallei]VCJ28998.1 Uncharacterised protein [Burkholderia pseudomallei]
MRTLIAMVLLALLLFAIVATVASAQGGANQHLLIDDTDVYYGFVPSTAAGAHPASHAEAAMHGGVPGSRNSYHLTVALFDHATQKRITDAQVTAAVGEIGLGETRRKLEPMTIDGTVTYGAYFKLGGTGPYRVRIEARRPDRAGKVPVQFEYRPQ